MSIGKFFKGVGNSLSGFASAATGGLLDLGGAALSNRWSKAESRRNRNFQERMSNTAIQRMRRDAEAAGFNPLLFMPGGASSPGGSMAKTADLSSIGTKSVATGLQAKLQAQSLKNMQAQEQLTNAQTAKTRVDAGASQAQMQNTLQSQVTGMRQEERLRLQNDLLRPTAELMKANNEVVIDRVIKLIKWVESVAEDEGRRFDFPAPWALRKAAKEYPQQVIGYLEQLFEDYGPYVSPVLYYLVNELQPKRTVPPFENTKKEKKR